jgi:hypothetical protein
MHPASTAGHTTARGPALVDAGVSVSRSGHAGAAPGSDAGGRHRGSVAYPNAWARMTTTASPVAALFAAAAVALLLTSSQAPCVPVGTCTAGGGLPSLTNVCGALGAGLETCGALLSGTCAVDDGTFHVRGGIGGRLSLAQAQFGSGGSRFIGCNLTGSFYAHPYAYHFHDVVDSPEMLEFTAADLGLPLQSGGRWGFGWGDFTVTGWLQPGATFATGVQDPAKNWVYFFSKANPGPGQTQYGMFAALYRGDRIIFGVEDNPLHRIEVTCQSWGCDSCLPRSACGDASAPSPGGRQLVGDPCAPLGPDFATCGKLEVGRWVMLSFVRAQNTLRVFVNGELRGERAVPPTDVSNSGDFRVGSHPVFETGMNMDGFIDDYRVFDYALGAEDVAALAGTTWPLHCYGVTPPANALPGSCAVPTEFNPGGVFHPDGYLSTGTWCNFACSFGYELVGRRPYCNYGFNLGNASCMAVEVGENCTDPLAYNYVAPPSSCRSVPQPGNGSGAMQDCGGACVPRGECAVDSPAAAGDCEALFSVPLPRAERFGCRGSTMEHGQRCTAALATQHGCEYEPSGGRWQAGVCVEVATADAVAGASTREGCSFSPTGFDWVAPHVPIEDGSCNYTCDVYTNFGSLSLQDVNRVCEVQYNACVGCEALSPRGKFELCGSALPRCVPRGSCTSEERSCMQSLAAALASDVYPKAGSAQLMAVLDCVKAAKEAEMTQCMIFAHNPWVWNDASSGLIDVRAGMGFLMQGASGASEYLGRVRVTRGTLVARHVRLRGQAASSGGAVAVAGGSVTVDRCVLHLNQALGPATASPSEGTGGAVFVSGAASLTVRSSSFVGNRAAVAGGAIALDVSARAVIAGSTFVGNHAGAEGGALWCLRCTLSLSSATALRQNSVGLGNVSQAAAQPAGGRRRRLVAPPSRERADGPGVGGGVYISGATFVADAGCVIQGNHAPVAGAGVYAVGGAASMWDVTIRSNNATVGGVQTLGGGVYADSVLLRIERGSVVAENSAAEGPELYLIDLPDGWVMRDTQIGAAATANSTWASYDPVASIAAIRLPFAGCDRHSCGPGFACQYAKYSTICTRCHEVLFSDDGQECKWSPPLHGVSADGLLAGTYPLQSPNQEAATLCDAAYPSPFGVCLPCPRGKQANRTSGLSCVDCGPGLVSRDGLSCQPCQPAFEPNQNDSAATDCLPCVSGLHSAAGAACIECPDSFVATADRTSCEPVQSCLVTDPYPGVFSPDGGKTCKPCPYGTAVRANQSGCDSCVGAAVSPLGVSCRTCPPATQPNIRGTWMSEWRRTHQTFNRTDCVSCEEVGVAAYRSDSSVLCLYCPRGKVPNANRTGCSDCASTDLWLIGHCEQCPSGKRPNAGGGSGPHTVCEACPVGFAGVDGTCARCPNGTQPNVEHVFAPAVAASCSSGANASTLEACEHTGHFFRPATCFTNDASRVPLPASTRLECQEACQQTGNTFTPARCSNNGNASTQATCERTGNVFSAAEEAMCSNNGDPSSQADCERTGNTYYFIGGQQVCTNGGDASSPAACELTGNVFTPAKPDSCTRGGNASSRSACELTGNSFTPAVCSNGGDATTRKSCEQRCVAMGNIFTVAACLSCVQYNVSKQECDRRGLVWSESTWKVGVAIRKSRATCSNGGDSSSAEACELTGNVYSREPYADWYTDGMWFSPMCSNGDTSSQELCEETNNTFTPGIIFTPGMELPPKCFNARTGSREHCERTFHVYTPGVCLACAEAGDASSQNRCELTGHTYTPATGKTCSNGGDPSSRRLCEQAAQITCEACAPGFAGVHGLCRRCYTSEASEASGLVDRYQSLLTPTQLLEHDDPGTCANCGVCVPESVCVNDRGQRPGLADPCTAMGPGVVSCRSYLLGRVRDSCHLCPAGQYSFDGVRCRRCEAGYEVNQLQTGCVACPTGRYSPDGTDCVTCTVGQEMNAPIAATGCLSCQLRGPGYHSSDGVWCRECFSGTEPNSDLSDCRPCPAWMAGPPGRCALCPSGTRPLAHRASCERCPAAHAGQFGRCDRCPDGFEPNAGRTGCVPCAEGQAGRGGACAPCGRGTHPVAASNCSNPALPDEAACAAEAGICSDASVTSRQACISQGTCCIVSVTPGTGVFVASSCVSPTLQSDCVLPDELSVHGRGALSRAVMSWTPLEWTPANLWTAVRSECAPCRSYEYGPDGKTCARCRPGLHVTANNFACTQCPDGSFSNGADGVLRVPVTNLTTAVDALARVGVPPVSLSFLLPDPPGETIQNRTGGAIVRTNVTVQLTASARPPVALQLSVRAASGQSWTSEYFTSMEAARGSHEASRPHKFGSAFSTAEVSFVVSMNQSNSGTIPSLDLDGARLTITPALTGHVWHAGGAASCFDASTGLAFPAADEAACKSTGHIYTAAVAAIEDRCDGQAMGGVNCTDGFVPGNGTTCAQNSSNLTRACVYRAAVPGAAARCSDGTTNSTLTACTVANRSWMVPSGYCTDSRGAGVPATDEVSCVYEASAPCPAWDAYCNQVYISSMHERPARANTTDLALGLRMAWGGGAIVEAREMLHAIACASCRPGTEPRTAQGGGARDCRLCSSLGLGYHSADGLRCKLCAAGKLPTPDRARCVPCPPTHYGVDGHCYACPSGDRPTPRQTACEPCPRGHVGLDGACALCANGTQPNAERLACLPCPEAWAGVLGVCSPCPQSPNASVPNVPAAGPYSGGTRCVYCVDQYSPDGVRCHTCPRGYQVNGAMNGCEVCAIGFVSPDGVRCVRCPAGFEFNNYIDRSIAPPMLNHSKGATGCRGCLMRGRGYFSPDGGECEICPAGWRPNAEHSACEHCPIGTQRSGSPTELMDRECDVCPDGQKAWGRVSCPYCPPNQAGRNGVCKKCEHGKQPSPAHVFCEACPRGYAGLHGYCERCATGTIADEDSIQALGFGATACRACPARFFANADGQCEQCLAGTQPNASASGCEACPPGRAGVDGHCRPCRPLVRTPVGMRGETPNAQRTDCIYTPATICGALAREHADNETTDLRREWHEVNVSAKAWMLLPLSLTIALVLVSLYGAYRFRDWLEHRRVFGKVAPLKSMLGERPYPACGRRFAGWLWKVLQMVGRCQCRTILASLRQFCLPAQRAPPPPPPEVPEELEPYVPQPKTPEDTEEEFEEAGHYDDAPPPNAGPAFEHQEHEAAAYDDFDFD